MAPKKRSKKSAGNQSASVHPASKKAPKTGSKASKPGSASSLTDADAVLAALRKLASKKVRDGMARYAIPSDNALGVSVGQIRTLAKAIGRNHDLAAALWETGVYEARMLTAFIDDPALVTPAQMDRWCRDFDNWAICDTLCFHLFDRTPHRFKKIKAWAGRREDFVKRAAFALLASVALHDKAEGDAPFAECLPLIDRAADDNRNFVKKGVSWALRSVGRRSAPLHAMSMSLARQLAESEVAARRWIGKDAAKDLAKAKIRTPRPKK